MSQQGLQHQRVGQELFRLFSSSSIHTPLLWSLGAMTRHFRGSVGMFSNPAVRPWPGWLVLESGKTEGERKHGGHIRGAHFLISGLERILLPHFMTVLKNSSLNQSYISVEKMCNGKVSDKRQDKQWPYNVPAWIPPRMKVLIREHPRLMLPFFTIASPP